MILASENKSDRKLKAEMETKKFNVLKDPIHGTIHLNPLVVKIIDTPEFQRLRNLSQMGLVQMLYPGAVHTRFEHCIGTAYLARKFAEALKEKCRHSDRDRGDKIEIDDKDVVCVEIAGLVHDLGHGPLSHAYDGMYLPRVSHGLKHEDLSEKIFQHLLDSNKLSDWWNDQENDSYKLTEDDIEFIKELVNPREEYIKDLEDFNEGKKRPEERIVWPMKGRGEEKSFLYEIVSNKLNGLDVDKWDYLARDAYYTGKTFAGFDNMRFMMTCTVKCLDAFDGRRHIVPRDKELPSLCEMLYTRTELYKSVNHHRVVEAANYM